MRAPRLLVLVAAAGMVLAGCGGADEDTPAAEGSAEAAFPVTIKHAYGETTIERKPERVATVAWANHEVPLALGVVPVGMSKATWGDDDGDGVLPWVEDKLTALGAKTPVLFDETDGYDFEAVADTQPDVILASYSGVTKQEYDTLSKIAPVVAYPDVAWGTKYQDMIRLNSEAIGLKAEGERLVTDLERQVSDALAKYPSLKGSTAVHGSFDPKDLSKVGFYTTHDPRQAFLGEAGLETPKVVTDASAKSEEFYLTQSAEQSDAFSDVDLFVTYGDAATLSSVQANPLLSKVPALQKGAVALLGASTPLAASANPSPLSIPWGIDKYFSVLAQAADKSQA